MVELPSNLTFDAHALTAAIASVIGSGATAAFLTWKKIVKERNASKLEDTKTNAEIDVVKHLQSQRDYAMAEAKESKRSQMLSDYEAQNAKSKISALEAELNNLRSRVQLLSQLVTRLTTALDLTRNQLTSILKKTGESHK